jgi:hypothetical protein
MIAKVVDLINAIKPTKSWQWLYRIESSPLWSISNFYMTAEAFKGYVEDYNTKHPHHPIVEFKRAKLTKIMKLEPVIS